MAGGGPDIGSYSPLTGFVFIFNLIVGAGALTIPHAFAQVGLIYGSMVLAVLAATSYVTATFMVEAIAGVNALKKRERQLGLSEPKQQNGANGLGNGYDDNDDDDVDDDRMETEFTPLMVPTQTDDKLEKKLRVKSPDVLFKFDLSKKMELAQMAETLFSRNGNIAFYACVIVYLYGDLAIYAVAVPKSMREIVCPRPSPGVSIWNCSEQLDSSQLYKLFVVAFGLLLGPFAFGHVSKTRTLQFITTVVRHVSFGLMILLATIGIFRGEGRTVEDVLSYERPENITTFFGVCIYSFMCHHSIPGFIAPITNKARVGFVMACAFAAVLCVYFVLSYSATFRFQPDEIDVSSIACCPVALLTLNSADNDGFSYVKITQDVYTLNFKNYPIRAVAYFLSLFPVCTLSANFPVITITLRENLRTLAHSLTGGSEETHDGEAHEATDEAGGVLAFVSRHMYALVAIVPPLVVAFFTEDVSMLVGFTGAYAGLGIQWIVPTCLVFCLRRRLENERARAIEMAMTMMANGSNGSGGYIKSELTAQSNRNPFASPFAHVAWLYVILGCALASTVIITISHFKQKPHKLRAAMTSHAHRRSGSKLRADAPKAYPTNPQMGLCCNFAPTRIWACNWSAFDLDGRFDGRDFFRFWWFTGDSALASIAHLETPGLHGKKEKTPNNTASAKEAKRSSPPIHTRAVVQLLKPNKPALRLREQTSKTSKRFLGSAGTQHNTRSARTSCVGLVCLLSRERAPVKSTCDHRGTLRKLRDH